MSYTTKEVADALKVSKPTLLRWIREGFIPDVNKDGRSWRTWTEEDVEKVRKFMEMYHHSTSDKDVLRKQKIRAYAQFGKRNKYVEPS
jgi:excisionase family DNA binding protein